MRHTRESNFASILHKNLETTEKCWFHRAFAMWACRVSTYTWKYLSDTLKYIFSRLYLGWRGADHIRLCVSGKKEKISTPLLYFMKHSRVYDEASVSLCLTLSSLPLTLALEPKWDFFKRLSSTSGAGLLILWRRREKARNEKTH